MPLYEYRCPQCGRTEEVEHSIHDSPPMVCEHDLPIDPTGTDLPPSVFIRMERVISAPTVIFKGSGFYETDYKHK